MHLVCVDCAAQHLPGMLYACHRCGGILEVMNPEGIPVSSGSALHSSMWRYGVTLPVETSSYVVSLGEGATPLLRADRLRQTLRCHNREIWLKDETGNPTGSFKDRHISVAVSRARELGTNGIVCASSGNAGASAAAYAARAGLPAIIVVPAHAPVEKLTQIAAYGAILVKVDGHYSISYRVAQQFAERYNLANVTTTYVNPYGTAALNTVAYELFEQLGGVPDYVLVPTGAGPLVKGVVQGFRQISHSVPKVVAVQAEGCAPIVRAYERGESTVTAWGTPATIASGISDPLIGYERDGSYTLRLVRETNGFAVAVSDDEIRAAMHMLATHEGVLAEPTGASSVAAVIKLIDRAFVPGERIVCLITGHGFKDFKIMRQLPTEIVHLSAGEEAEILDKKIVACIAAANGEATIMAQ